MQNLVNYASNVDLLPSVESTISVSCGPIISIIPVRELIQNMHKSCVNSRGRENLIARSFSLARTNEGTVERPDSRCLARVNITKLAVIHTY